MADETTSSTGDGAQTASGSHPALATDVLDTLADEVAVVDSDGIIVATNAAWRAFSRDNDLKTGSLVGTDYMAAADDSDDEHATAAANGLRAVLAGDREEFELEYPCHSPSQRRWFLLRARPLTRGGARHAVVSHTDITERRLAEDAVTETAAELAEQRAQLTLLNQVVSHDIRNDIAVILGEVQLLRERADGQVGAGLERIDRAGRRVGDLTDSVRELGRLVTQEVPSLSAVPLAPILRSEARTVIDGRPEGVESVTVTGVDDLPSVSVLATDLLSSVFGNLFSNAVLHHDRPDPEIEVAVVVDERTVTVTIADDGPGIPGDRTTELLGRGEKGPASPGTGLGLYLVDQLIDLYDGSLVVSDNDPRGTVFTVELQRAQ